jgi:hypothetical protein
MIVRQHFGFLRHACRTRFFTPRGDQSPSTSDAAGASSAAPLGPADIAAVPGMQSGSVRRILGEMIVDLRVPLVAAVRAGEIPLIQINKLAPLGAEVFTV